MTNISNPFSTGAGGATFEARIQTSYVLNLICGGFIPGLPEGIVEKIKLQGKIEGYDTDDAVVYLKTDQGHEYKLLAQIKHDISFTESSDVLNDVLTAAWGDFSNPSFTEGHDTIALITGPMSKIDNSTIVPILDWAKNLTSADTFIKRVSTSRFSSKQKQEKLQVIRKKLDTIKGSALSDDELWVFCKSWTVLTYDLDTPNSTYKNALLSYLQTILKSTSVSPVDAWNKVLNYVQDLNQNAGVIELSSIPEEVKKYFVNYSKSSESILRLFEHGEIVKRRINENINSIHIERKDELEQILESYHNNSFTIVSGVAGAGKSALAKKSLHLLPSTQVFYLRAEDFNYSHIDKALLGLGIKERMGIFLSKFHLFPKKVIVIESLEKILELESPEAFLDLISMIRVDDSVSIIATCRDYSLPQLTSFFLEPNGINPFVIELKLFNDDELLEVENKLPQLKKLLANPKLRDLLRSPFCLDLANRISLTEESGTSLEDFQKQVWEQIIQSVTVRKNGLPLKREKAFIGIAVKRAKQMSFAVSVDDFDAGAVSALQSDNVIVELDNGEYAISHDLLEDWGIERFLNQVYSKYAGEPFTFFQKIGSELAIQRTFRNWFQDKCSNEKSRDELKVFILSTLTDDKVESHWKDEVIQTILLSDDVDEIITMLKGHLVEDNYSLLKRFCFILQITCKGPDYDLINMFCVNNREVNQVAPSFLKPIGQGWHSILKLIYAIRDDLDTSLLPVLTPVLKDFAGSINVYRELPEGAREAGLLALLFLDRVKDDYRNNHIKDLSEVTLKTYRAIKTEFDSLMTRCFFGEEKSRYGRDFDYIEKLVDLILTDASGTFLIISNPQLVIDIAWKKWKKVDEDDYSHSLDIWRYFGFVEHHSSKSSFTTGSPLIGPFFSLLRFHPKVGLSFVVELSNYAALNYSESSLSNDELEKLAMNLQNGESKELICSGRLWNAHRGTSVSPGIIDCSLMALEKWLVQKLERNESVNEELKYILDNSNSALSIALLVSITNGFWKQIDNEILYPLMSTKEFYSYDIARHVQDMTSGRLNWFGLSFDPMADYYAEEKVKSSNFEWRKEYLEHQVGKMLFDSEKRDFISAILDEFHEEDISNDVTWQITLNRLDLRKCTLEKDKENNRVLFRPPELPEDIKTHQKEFQSESDSHSRVLRLKMWGQSCFKNEKYENAYETWREGLEELKWFLSANNNGTVNEFHRLAYDGVLSGVAYVLRDHADDLEDVDFVGLSLFVCEVLENTLNNEGNGSVKPDLDNKYSIASILPLIVKSKWINDEVGLRVQNCILLSLTHFNHCVQLGIAVGLREYVWESDTEFVQKCLGISIVYSKVHRELIYEYPSWVYEGKEENYKNYINEINAFREKVLNDEVELDGYLNDISFKTHSSWDLLSSIEMIPTKDVSSSFVELIYKFVDLLIVAEENKRTDERDKIANEFKWNLLSRISKIIEVDEGDFFNTFIDKYKDYAVLMADFFSSLIKRLTIYIPEFMKNERCWTHLSYMVIAIKPVIKKDFNKSIEDIYHRDFTQLIRSLMLDFTWKNITDSDKEIISCGKRYFGEVFNELGENLIIYEGYLKLCYYFEDVFMPDSIINLSGKLLDHPEAVYVDNTKYCLEKVLQRYIIKHHFELSKKPAIKARVIKLLNGLIEGGSSTGYFLRERIITIR